MDNLGRYRITYSCGTTQTKCLVSHDEYLSQVVPLENEIYQAQIAEKSAKTPAQKEHFKRLELALKKKLKDLLPCSDYFTNKSPIFEVINTGILVLPPQQGGARPCNVKQIFYE